MAASVYHVISKEVENHIFGHNWSFRHTCMYKQPTLTKQWNYNIFVQIYIYFRYTAKFFLGCAFLMLTWVLSELHEKPRREVWVTEKVHGRIYEGHHFFDSMPSFLCHFLFLFLSTPSPLPSDILAEWPLKRYIILQWLVFCVMIPCVNS